MLHALMFEALSSLMHGQVLKNVSCLVCHSRKIARHDVRVTVEKYASVTLETFPHLELDSFCGITVTFATLSGLHPSRLAHLHICRIRLVSNIILSFCHVRSIPSMSHPLRSPHSVTPTTRRWTFMPSYTDPNVSVRTDDSGQFRSSQRLVRVWYHVQVCINPGAKQRR